MKIRNLAIIFALGMLIASCTDKKAQEEITKLKADMAAADSLCQADKAMLMDSIMKLDSLLNPPANTTSSGSGSGTKTTTTTTTTTTGEKSVGERGEIKVVDKNVNERGGDDGSKTVKKDINKRGGN